METKRITIYSTSFQFGNLQDITLRQLMFYEMSITYYVKILGYQ